MCFLTLFVSEILFRRLDYFPVSVLGVLTFSFSFILFRRTCFVCERIYFFWGDIKKSKMLFADLKKVGDGLFTYLGGVFLVFLTFSDSILNLVWFPSGVR